MLKQTEQTIEKIKKTDKKVAFDIFSGSGSATKYFRESNDWLVIDIELNDKNYYDSERIDIEEDVTKIKPENFEQVKNKVKFIWASPPCKSFSMAGDNSWSKKNERLRAPNQSKAVEGINMVYQALLFTEILEPEYWFMENPRGGLRAIIGEPQHAQRREMDEELLVREQKDANYPGTVTYCQYGDNRMKPTDLWGEHPDNIQYKFCGNGEDCHVSASRGSDTGTQGLKEKNRWKIPDELAHKVFKGVNEQI